MRWSRARENKSQDKRTAVGAPIDRQQERSGTFAPLHCGVAQGPKAISFAGKKPTQSASSAIRRGGSLTIDRWRSWKMERCNGAESTMHDAVLVFSRPLESQVVA
jgi:hypothetical protein